MKGIGQQHVQIIESPCYPWWMDDLGSIRRYAHTPLSLEELAFLLWATQGVTERHGDEATFRPVPSAGARHAFETYLYCRRVEKLEEGIYLLDHQR